MPARSFRVDIANASGFFLRKTGEYVVHGTYTDGWPSPAATINPGVTASFQGESKGVLTGSEGRVVYTVEDFQGGPRGSFCIHWDAPWQGNSTYGLDQSLGLITLDSGGNMVWDPNPLTSKPPQSFKVGPTSNAGDSDDAPNDGDGHARMSFEVDGLEPGFTSPPPPNYGTSLPGPVVVGDWSGDFTSSDGSVSITLALEAHQQTSALVTIGDKGAANLPPLDLKQSVDLTSPAQSHRPPIMEKRVSSGTIVKPEAATKAKATPFVAPSPAERDARIAVTTHAPTNLHVLQHSISIGEHVVLTLLWEVGAPATATEARAIRYQRFGVADLPVKQDTCVYRPPPPR